MEIKNESITLLHTKKEKFREKNGRLSYILLISYSLLLILIGLFSGPFPQLLTGTVNILTSPSHLLTDYIQLGSFNSAFFNSGVLTLVSVLLTKRHKLLITGPVIAALFTVSGCSFFGKNLYNSIPIIIGGYLYCRIAKKPFSSVIVVSLFGSALSPIISYITFGLSLPLVIGIPLSYAIGILLGMILPPLASHVLIFHQGFSLYNIGFTSGLIAMLFTSSLKMFGKQVETQNIISTTSNGKLMIFLAFLFTLMFITGFILNHFSFKGLKAISKTSGKLVTDFISITSVGPTLMNMAMMGFLLLLYVVISGGTLNGPILGAILSAVGFSAFGNHPLNSFPLLVGIFLTAKLSLVFQVDQTVVVMTGIFGTSLAPIAGFYGPIYGVIAGFFHMALVTNVSFLHGGLNLYNNGFSTGFVAAIMVPLLDNIFQIRKVNQHAGKRKSKKNY
ncbi:hypothetical protein A5888_000270 [Enterococcus sp. 9E7_DIV0242]|uniref:DUF1576 domain-containing protein n=1 Tax=Candidatus Enterococcus clewellii TaxID=1834193 RepID=A0A242KBF5_9ENTE|nr:DUF1576 domain-containing protein [Enterococcus sp. 9E7_DIV0242]OTP18504.1 hypothetical protein A5888_000318 [Enterococcus sp. 9E7_DIV0242]